MVNMVPAIAERRARKRQSRLVTCSLQLTLTRAALTFTLTPLIFPASSSTGQGAPSSLHTPSLEEEQPTDTDGPLG